MAATVLVGLVVPGADAARHGAAAGCRCPNPPLSGPAWPSALTLRPVLLAAAAVAAALGTQLTIRRSSTGGNHATAHRP